MTNMIDKHFKKLEPARDLAFRGLNVVILGARKKGVSSLLENLLYDIRDKYNSNDGHTIALLNSRKGENVISKHLHHTMVHDGHDIGSHISQSDKRQRLMLKHNRDGHLLTIMDEVLWTEESVKKVEKHALLNWMIWHSHQSVHLVPDKLLDAADVLIVLNLPNIIAKRVWKRWFTKRYDTFEKYCKAKRDIGKYGALVWRNDIARFKGDGPTDEYMWYRGAEHVPEFTIPHNAYTNHKEALNPCGLFELTNKDDIKVCPSCGIDYVPHPSYTCGTCDTWKMCFGCKEFGKCCDL